VPAGLVIRVDGARIAAGTLIATNGRRFDTIYGYASGTIRQHTIKLFDTAFDWEAMHVSGSSKLTAADPMKISGAAHITLTWPEQPVWTIDATADGDLDVLPVQASFSTPLRADFQGAARDLTSGWNWSGEAQVHDFDLRAWGAGNALGRVTGTLAVHGDANGFAADGPLTPAGLAAGAFQTSFKGSYDDRVVTADRIEVRHPNGTVLTGAGTIAVADNGPRLDLHGDWHDFRWPLVGKDVGVRSAGGSYQLSGLWPYDWRASGPIEIRDFAPMPAQARGRLAKDRVYLDEVALDIFSGHAMLSGEALWTPDERWHVKGNAAGIDPSAVRPDLPGKVAFDFDAQGVGFDGQGDFSVALKNIAGKLRGVAASGGGSIARQGAGWQLDDIRIALGGTTIQASGRIASEMNIGFSIAAEDLSWLNSDAHGHLDARGRVQGTTQDPVVVASVKGSQLRHGEFHLASLDARIDFDSRNTHASSVAVEARGLSHRKRTIDALDFKLAGPASRHAIELHGTAPNLSLDLHAEGSFAHGAWNGQLGALEIGGGESLNLALDAPVAAVVAAQQVKIDWFCLHGAPGKVCADVDWKPEKWAASIKAAELPLRTLTAGLTPEVDYRGCLTVNARASGAHGERPQGTLRADLVDARMVHRLASGLRQSILLGSGSVTLVAGPDAIDSRVELDAGPVGTIKGQTTLARNTDRWQDMPLTGHLEVHTAELGFVTLYAPQIDRAAGKLDSEMTLTGTAGTPLVDGNIKLSDAELDQYQVNLAMRGVNITARLHGNGLSYQGSARIGDGGMQTSGELAWRDALPYGKLHLQGDRLRVANVPEAHIDASPDLDFDIEGRRISVSGKVEIPYAKIEPTDLRNAVRSSADEIIVGQEAQGPADHFEVVTDIELALSEGVSIDTSGLTGHLTGGIRVRSGQDDMTRATGELSVVDGKYSAYGRKLDIERGRLIFTGGPVGNPGVDIRAVKEFPDMKAGVNVRGTLLQPRLTFFSEPSLPQSQILSLILAGGSLSQSTASTTTTTGRQVGGGGELLAQGGALLAQQLGEKVGIEDVSVEQNLSNETSLVLGKYLSPRLYVSYGISLAESINTLKMRYTLNDHWTIRSEVGEARGADLVYTIEK
jgi:translocation and assembly module TamB